MAAETPGQDATGPEPHGGSGGEEPHATKFDVGLYELALRSRWEIPPATRQKMVRELSAVVREKGMLGRKPRLYTAAAKVLAMLDGINLRGVDVAIRAKSAEDLEARVAALEAKGPSDDLFDCPVGQGPTP